MNRSFYPLLEMRWQEDRRVCVGLDTDVRKLPGFLNGDVITFNKAIVDATKAYAGCYKVQTSYYEAEGEQGLASMRETVQYIHEVAPEIAIIADAKRADIGSTNEGYVKAIFDTMGFDAVTLHPYLGGEALKPFLERTEKGSIILCRNSNPGAGEFQDLKVTLSEGQFNELTHGPAGEYGSALKCNEEMPLYLYVALRVANHWNYNKNCSLVVGATYPEQAATIRQAVGDMPFLIPGIGAQGGDLPSALAASKNSRNEGVIVNSSRGIIFASSGADYAEAAGREARNLNDAITQQLTQTT